MKRKHERELWKIRFEKLFEMEKESLEFYQKLLKEKGGVLKKTGVKPVIQRIMRDEGRHMRIAKDLIDLVKEKR